MRVIGASFAADGRRWVLAAAALLTLVAGALGPAVADAVRTGGFEDPSSDSARAAAVLEDAFGPSEADVVVLWRHQQLTPADPAFAAEVQGVVATLPTTPSPGC